MEEEGTITNIHLVHSINNEEQGKETTGGETGTGTGGRQTPDAPNTGHETLLGSSSESNFFESGIITYIPLAFVLVGIVLALSAFCVNVKKKRSQKKGMKLNTANRSRMTKAIYISAFAMATIGVGGNVYLKSQASATESNNSGDLYATLVKRDEASSLYCGTDNLKLSTKNTQGYMIRMNGSTLESKSGEADIVSIEDWGDLALGTWGFFTDYTKHGTEGSEEDSFVPLPKKNGVITNTTNVSGKEETVPVTFCARISNATPEGEYVGVVRYNGIMFETPGLNDTGDTLTEESYIDYNSKDDSDGDGISDRKENQIGTNVISKDTDFDRLSDSEELYVYGTDPFNEDTDGDTVTDFSELALKAQNFDFDPVGQNDKDKFIDGFHYIDEKTGIEMELHGTGNLPQTYVDAHHIKILDGETKAHIYSFETDGTLAQADDAAVVTIPYKNGDFNNYGEISGMTFNNFNEKGEVVEEGFKVASVNEGANKLTVELPHFSDYVIEPGGLETTSPTSAIEAMIQAIKKIIKIVIDIILKSIIDPQSGAIVLPGSGEEVNTEEIKPEEGETTPGGSGGEETTPGGSGGGETTPGGSGGSEIVPGGGVKPQEETKTKEELMSLSTSEAQKMANYYVNTLNPSGWGFWEGTKWNCTAMVMWFVKAFTTLGKNAVVDGNGRDVAYNLATRYNLDHGETAKPMSIYSVNDAGGTAKCWSNEHQKYELCGHTGVVVGIDENNNAITLEASYGNPSFQSVRARSTKSNPKFFTNVTHGQDYVFAYLYTTNIKKNSIMDYKKLADFLSTLR